MIRSAADPGQGVIRRASGRIATVSLFAALLLGSLYLALEQISNFTAITDVGFGDSYVFYDVAHFQRTGTIYRDLSSAPYLPAQYSPLVYMLYSLPGQFMQAGNPLLGPRAVALAAFLLCVLTIVWISRALIAARSTWIWAALLASSMTAMRPWVLQLRGDFPGIFFNLLAVRLLLARKRWAILAAGVSAGFATQFKFVYIAGLVAGFLWLAMLRRWRELGVFTAAGMFSSVGFYLLFWAREHRMLGEMMALSPGVADVPGVFKLLLRAGSEPVVLLAILAISPAVLKAGARWGLLMLFGAISLCVAMFTDIQAGGNVNYFFEPLFALVPAAVLGVRRLLDWSEQEVGAGLFVAALAFFYALLPMAKDLYYGTDTANGALLKPGEVRASNARFSRLEEALAGQHIFATVPRIAMLDADPVLVEPYLFSYWLRLHKFDGEPILAKIRADEFDVVVTMAQPQGYRGIPHIGPELRSAIESAYQPYCVCSDYLFHLPIRREKNAVLETRLNGIGCTRLQCDRPSSCAGW